MSGGGSQFPVPAAVATYDIIPQAVAVGAAGVMTGDGAEDAIVIMLTLDDGAVVNVFLPLAGIVALTSALMETAAELYAKRGPGGIGELCADSTD